MRERTGKHLAERVRAGDRIALARLISRIENADPVADGALARLHAATGRCHGVGVTGPPGTGKSTLVNAIAREVRRRGRTVGIVAVDPTSPFTGGALLGDRIRMQELHQDPGVFIRSMASRGAAGGLAETTLEVADAFDAFGFDLVVIETVGAGQVEVAVARAAHTTVVVSMPGMGDEIQAIKAGILEIADVFVLNKADRATAADLAMEMSLAFDQGSAGWRVPVLRTVATAGEGIGELVDALERHREFLEATGELSRRRASQARQRLLALAQRRWLATLLASPGAADALDRLSEAVAARARDPYSAAEELLALLPPELVRGRA
ncbi:MAG: methylmalonyl Co-A mutase-associated GTPase MeaB [Chloroflexi bacterium]|nr:methylmalonyl Co-A mutase-associated GTPase MeaB [Chloroflexota bacterium]